MSDRSVTPPINADLAARVTPGPGTIVHRKPLTVVVSSEGDTDRIARGITEVVEQLIGAGDLSFGPVAAGLQQFVVDHQPTGVAAVLDVAPDAIAFLFDQAVAIGDATTHRASGRSGWTTVFVEGDSVSLVAGPGPERPVDPWSQLWAGTVAGQGVQVDLHRSSWSEPSDGPPVAVESNHVTDRSDPLDEVDVATTIAEPASSATSPLLAPLDDTEVGGSDFGERSAEADTTTDPEPIDHDLGDTDLGDTELSDTELSDTELDDTDLDGADLATDLSDDLDSNDEVGETEAEVVANHLADDLDESGDATEDESENQDRDRAEDHHTDDESAEQDLNGDGPAVDEDAAAEASEPADDDDDDAESVIELEAEPIDLSTSSMPTWSWPPPVPEPATGGPVETMANASAGSRPTGATETAGRLDPQQTPPAVEPIAGPPPMPADFSPPGQGAQAVPGPPPATGPTTTPSSGPASADGPPPSPDVAPISGPPPMPGTPANGAAPTDLPPPPPGAQPIAGPPPMPGAAARRAEDPESD